MFELLFVDVYVTFEIDIDILCFSYTRETKTKKDYSPPESQFMI